MLTFERQQRILSLLKERSGIKVTELAKLFSVSEGTIRNDLNALERAGQVTRVRGGAIPREQMLSYSSAFAARAQVGAEAKQRIARWAADLVRDGDSILLDAGTSAFYMTPLLKERRSLTIVTNGLEIARILAQNTSHTVILVGGQLSADGSAVTGLLGECLVENLHIRTAFMSCSGFSIEAGLTQDDIQEAQLKSKMIRSAERVAALVDASKFGKTDLTPFASIAQVSHVFTDDELEPRFVEQLRQTNVLLTVCGQDTVSSYLPISHETAHYKIGFANLREEQSPFALDVRHGLEQASRRVGNLDLIVADNRMDGEVALKMADRLIADEVDLAIEYQIDERAGNLIASKFHQAGIPVIAVDIPMVGATYFGVDNYRAGRLAGNALGRWLEANWEGRFGRLIIFEQPRAGPAPAARVRGQLDGLQEVVGEVPPKKIVRLDGGNTSETSRAAMTDALKRLPSEHRLAVISFSDSSTIGAQTAAREVGREADVIIVGQGADKPVREQICRPGSRVIGATAFWPERYGAQLMDVALKILRGEQVPPAVYIDHVFIDAENIHQFYPE